MSNQPVDRPQSSNEQAPAKSSADDALTTNRQFVKLVDHVTSTYDIYYNRHNSVFLVDWITRRAFPIDDPHIENVIMYNFYERLGKRASKTAIRDALTAAKGYPERKYFDGHLHTRVVDNGEQIHLIHGPNEFDIIAISEGPLSRFERRTSSFGISDFQHNPAPAKPYYLNPAARGTSVSKDATPEIKKLFNTTNLPSEKYILIYAWLILSFIPRFKQVALQITGPVQSGKSQALDVIRRVIDPNAPVIRSAQKPKDIQPNLLANHLICLDTAEHINGETQQLLADCLDTYVLDSPNKRQGTYTVDIRRPIVLTNVESMITNPALLRSTLSIEIETINNDPSHWVDEEMIDQIQNDVVFRLKEVVAKTKSRDRRQSPPGLTDYCTVGRLLSQVLGEPSAFDKQLEKHQQEQLQAQIDDDDVALAIQRWVHYDAPRGQPTTMAVKEWMNVLAPYSDRGHSWPETGKKMSHRLKLAAPLLKRAGIDLKKEGKRGSYGHWSICVPESPNDRRTCD